jgi:hypothetical protein
MDKKVAIITFCIGDIPHWIDYFIRSCSYNKYIDWFYFTDKQLKGQFGSNIKVINTSLNELNVLVSAKTDVKASIRHPYKLCDFRPAFGIIFGEYLQDYDYWGYCDNDLIFGDILSFLGDVIMENYSIIIPHKQFSHGHFCLLRNTETVNNLFKLSPIYKDIFRSEKLHIFDERFDRTGISLDNDEAINESILKKIKKYRSYKRAINMIRKLKFWRSAFVKRRATKKSDLNDFNRIIRYLEEENKIRIYRETLYEDDIMKAIYSKGCWSMKWKGGKLYNENSKELLYFHFQLSKYNKSFNIIDNLREDNSFILESIVK